MEENNVDRYTLRLLERQLHNLSKLVEINGIINSTLDIGRLLTIIMEIIKEIMETEASTLLLYEEETRELVFKVALGEAGKELQERYRVKMGQGIAGWVAEHRRETYINDVYGDGRFDPNFDKKTGFTTRAMLCAPLLFKGKLLGVIQAINPLHKPGFDEDDVVLFKAFANQAVLAVQNAIFFQNAIEEERIRSELDSAHSVQSSLFPVMSRERENVAIAARSITAREVGGEFCDVFYFSDAAAVALGDIHTKGIPGALQASIVNGAVKALSQVAGENPSFIHKKIDALMREHVQSAQGLSLFYGVLSFAQRSFSFVNSGYAYPIMVKKGVARYLKIGGKPLGGEGVDFRKVRVTLEPGDFFIIITDGLIKQRNSNASQLGLKRVMDFLSRDFESPDAMVSALLAYANEFTGGLEKKEDISVLALKILR